jgi:superfamily I DNA/RNA helicase
MAVFVRSAMEVPRAEAAVAAAGLNSSVLDEALRAVRDRVPVATMHLTKGLEFRAVAVMGCDDEVLPLQARIESVRTRGIWRRSTTPSVTCSTWRVPEPETICSSPASRLRRSS